ncbi:MAG: hypothetical protein FWH21_02600, partial [Kiritimatiellaeota bacterium]|nr:hypothetical protein [Kiritimatiellota bacterium]
MMPTGFGYHQRSDDRNWILGCVAIMLSVVFHVAVMWYFKEMQLSRAGIGERTEHDYGADRTRPMLFERPVVDVLAVTDKIPGERDMPSRGPIEISDNIPGLIQETSPALVTPPPVPRDAISPDAFVHEAPKDIDPTPWMPRQEIAQIFDRTIQDELAHIKRHEIPVIERVPMAADIVPAIDLAGRQFGGEPEPPAPVPVSDVFDTEIIRGTFVVEMPAETITPKTTLGIIKQAPVPETTGGGGGSAQKPVPGPTRPPPPEPPPPLEPHPAGGPEN